MTNRIIPEKLKEWYYRARFRHAKMMNNRALNAACDLIRKRDNLRFPDCYVQDSSGWACKNYDGVDEWLLERAEFMGRIREWQRRMSYWDKREGFYRDRLTQLRIKQLENVRFITR